MQVEKPKEKTQINEALRLVRLYWGYTQSELAEMIEVSQSMVSGIEAGTKAVSMDLLEKYSTGLNIKMSRLLFFAEELADKPVQSRGKLMVAGKVLELLDAIAPKEKKTTD